MTKKKSSEANIEKNRKVFFFVGLILALSVTLIALEWSSNKSVSNESVSVPELQNEKVQGGQIFVIPETPVKPKPKYSTTENKKKKEEANSPSGKKFDDDLSRFTNRSKNQIDISLYPADMVYIDTAELPFIDLDPGTITKKVTDIDRRPYFASCCEDEYNPLCFDCTQDVIKRFIKKHIVGTNCVKEQGGIELIWTKVTINEVGNVCEVNIKNRDEVCPESAEQVIDAFLQLPQMVPGEYAGVKIRVSYYIPVKIRFMKS